MIDFLKYRFVCAAFSVLLIAGGTAAYLYHGGFNYHIDFVGGSELQVSFEKPLDIGALRTELTGDQWKDATIQSIGMGGNQFLIRVKQEGKELAEQFKSLASRAFVDNAVSIDNVSWVGNEVGSEIQWNAILSILLALLMILLYVAFRSEYSYGVGAVVALAHDLLAVLAILLVFNEQISLNVLAALLTTLGYSINDTIVIFSRIKENSAQHKGMSATEIVNLSINQTLRRTILTSLTTFLAVAALYFIGGPALHGFSFAMLIGVVAGTYSSIYIASPVMLALSSRGGRTSTLNG